MHSRYPEVPFLGAREQAPSTSTAPRERRTADRRRHTRRNNHAEYVAEPARDRRTSGSRANAVTHPYRRVVARVDNLAQPTGLPTARFSLRTHTYLHRPRTSAVASTPTRRAPAARSLRVGQRLDALPAVQPDSGHLDAMTTKGGANRGPVTADASGDVEQRGAQRQFTRSHDGSFSSAYAERRRATGLCRGRSRHTYSTWNGLMPKRSAMTATAPSRHWRRTARRGSSASRRSSGVGMP